MIIIEKPFIEQLDDVARLCAIIKYDNLEKKMFFEVHKRYREYLCDEVGDAFVVGLLNFAFSRGDDIESKAPVSERLLYQLNTYYIKTLSEERNFRYKPIKVVAFPYSGMITNAGAVATSASGGVDSFFSIERHIDISLKKFRLTHLLVANQFNHYFDEEETRKSFEKICEYSKEVAKNYDLELVTLYTNHHIFLFDGFVQEYTLRICSYIFALQKFFSIYYVSSGVPFKWFEFTSHDSDGFDIFNLSMLSTENLTFYSSGGENTRTEKIEYIAQDKFVQRKLKVCNFDEDKNCSVCEKCMRTMLSLDIIGILNEYKEVFDLDKFYKNKKVFLAVVESGQLEESKNFIREMKSNQYKIPLFSILFGKSVLRIIWRVKELAKKSSSIKKIYYKLKLDYVLHGKEKAILYRYGTDNQVCENNMK